MIATSNLASYRYTITLHREGASDAAYGSETLAQAVQDASTCARQGYRAIVTESATGRVVEKVEPCG